MFSLAIFCLLLAASSILALEPAAVDENEVTDDEHMSYYELFGNYGSHRESLAYERQIYTKKESFTWRDCGGKGSLFHLKSLNISPLPLRVPGNITVAFSVIFDADIEAPISVVLHAKKKVGLIWVNICKHIPGGCKRKDICNIGHTTTAAEAAAAAAAEGDGNEDAQQNSICPLKKGDFSLPPTTFALTAKAPSGWYSVKAQFYKGERCIACMYVKLNVK